MIASLFAMIVVVYDSEELLIVPTCGPKEYVVQVEACRLVILKYVLWLGQELVLRSLIKLMFNQGVISGWRREKWGWGWAKSLHLILLEHNQELILVTTDGLHEKDLRYAIKVCDDLLQVDVSLVENDIRVLGVDAIEHQFLVLDHIGFCLLGNVVRLAIHKQDDLAPTKQVVHHVGDALLEEDLVNDVLFISRVAFRLEMAKDFREGQDCQRAVLFVLSPLKTDSRGATILLRCVCRELFGVEELVLNTVPRFLKLLS